MRHLKRIKAATGNSKICGQQFSLPDVNMVIFHTCCWHDGRAGAPISDLLYLLKEMFSFLYLNDSTCTDRPWSKHLLNLVGCQPITLVSWHVFVTVVTGYHTVTVICCRFMTAQRFVLASVSVRYLSYFKWPFHSRMKTFKWLLISNIHKNLLINP